MTSLNKEYWKKYSYVMRSKNRQIIIKLLKEPKMPSDLAKESGIGINMTSRAIRQLLKQGIVKCNNPELTMGRFYELTQSGKEIVKRISSSPLS